MKTFYKSNKAVTGMLTNVSFDSKGQNIFVNLVRQKSWDDGKRVGGFAGGERLNVKFSAAEASGMIRALTRSEKFDFYHSFKDNKTFGSITYAEKEVGEGEKKTLRRGFYLNVKNGDKDGKTSLTLDEGLDLADFLTFAKQHMNAALYAAEKQRVKEYLEKKKADEGKGNNKPEQNQQNQQNQQRLMTVEI